MSMLMNQPIVLDNGTGSIRAGFSGAVKPKVAVSPHYPCALLSTWLSPS
jgi:actin-related protein